MANPRRCGVCKKRDCPGTPEKGGECPERARRAPTVPLKVVRVYADGRVENVDAKTWAGGNYEKVGDRWFVSHFATDANTALDGRLLDGATGPKNEGTVVLVEQRDHP